MDIQQNQDHPLPDSESYPYRSSGQWIYPLLASFLLLALLSGRLIDDSDLGFHLRSGQWILENHQFPSTDPFTYTVPNHSYTDMQWLYQIPLYLVYKFGGYPLISVFHIGLILLAFGLVFLRLYKTGESHGFSLLLFAVVLFASEFRFRSRPEVLSWILMGLTLWVLESWLDQSRDRLFLLPMIQWFWANTEGLFFIGWGLIGIYCVSSYFRNRKVDRKLFFWGFLSLAATWLNPYFMKGLYFPIKHLLELNSSDVFKNSVQELKSPWGLNGLALSAQFNNVITYMLFSIVLLLLIVFTFKKRKLHEILMPLAMFSISAVAIRNIPLFTLSCAPIAATCWNDLKGVWKWKFPEILKNKRIIPFGFTLIILGLCLRVITSAYYVTSKRAERFGIGINTELQPIRAAQFLTKNKLNGRILNSLDPGDWLEWQGRQKTFIDGRLHVMGKDLFTEYMASFQNGGLSSLAAKYQADIIFLSLNDPPQWILQLNGMPEWRLVYLDESDAVYLRKGYTDNIQAVDYSQLLADRGISKSLPLEAAKLIQISSPSKFDNCISDFYRRTSYPIGLSNLGIFCARTGHAEIAESLFLEAIQMTQGRYSDLYYNLGFLYFKMNKNDFALTCLERLLRDQPGNVSARNIVSKILAH